MANHTANSNGCTCTSVSAIGDERRMAMWNRLSPQFQTRRQLLGNKHTIGCVSLEITQRCNLDCTLCYLSELSEDVLDLPIEEVYRRIDQILEIYGSGTGVQISGGDPTLRDEEELVAIVRYASNKGLVPALLTNGIKATRRLLIRLVDAGLKDVAFHVDTTQRLKKYKNEVELNELRMRYIERVRGLKVRVVFNTTLHSGNMHELPDLVRFFVKNADVVGMCSFQLGADTGRGELHEGLTVSPDQVRKMVNQTLGVPLSFDAMDIGHSSCNRIGYSLICNGNAYDLWDDTKVLEAVLCDVRFEDFELDPDHIARSIAGIGWKLTRQPRLFVLGMGFLVRRLWQMRRDLIAGRGRIHKLSFMIHNFMDADKLDPERVQNCSFMVMTPTGPISMCLHNSQRDEHITKPLTVQIQGIQTTFDPLKPEVRERLVETER